MTKLVLATENGEVPETAEEKYEAITFTEGEKVEANYRGSGQWQRGIIRKVRYDGRFDVGILTDLQARVGHDAEGDEDEVHHHRQHGTTHRCIREPHVRESSWRVVRG